MHGLPKELHLLRYSSCKCAGHCTNIKHLITTLFTGVHCTRCTLHLEQHYSEWETVTHFVLKNMILDTICEKSWVIFPKMEKFYPCAKRNFLFVSPTSASYKVVFSWLLVVAPLGNDQYIACYFTDLWNFRPAMNEKC